LRNLIRQTGHGSGSVVKRSGNIRNHFPRDYYYHHHLLWRKRYEKNHDFLPMCRFISKTISDKTKRNSSAHSSAASVQTSYYSMWHYNYLCTL